MAKSTIASLLTSGTLMLGCGYSSASTPRDFAGVWNAVEWYFSADASTGSFEVVGDPIFFTGVDDGSLFGRRASYELGEGRLRLSWTNPGDDSINGAVFEPES